MLLIVVVAAALGVLVLSSGWVTTRLDDAGRRVMFPFMMTTLLVGVTVAAVVPTYRQIRLESELSAVARAISGRSDVRVSCQTPSQAWVRVRQERGYVEFAATGNPTVAVITPGTCGELKDWIRGGRVVPGLDQVTAVHVLTHEAMHLQGIRDEAEAECAALQRDEVTAQLLGATQSVATELRQAYVSMVYPSLPDNYRTSQCQPGGALDEQLDSSPWR